jgi:hypothetical protein
MSRIIRVGATIGALGLGVGACGSEQIPSTSTLPVKTAPISNIEYTKEGTRTYDLKTKIWEGKIEQRCSETGEYVISEGILEGPTTRRYIAQPLSGKQACEDDQLTSNEGSIIPRYHGPRSESEPLSNPAGP